MAVGSVVNKAQIEKCVKGLLKLTQKKQKNSLDGALEPEVINVQLAFKKIPKVKNNKIIKIPVPHKLVHEGTDICLFVRDLGGKSQDRDYEQTERFFTDMLAKKGINLNIKVIPLKCVKLEYQPYEARKNLSNMYDVFLADACILRILHTKLGKHFFARRKYPKKVDLDAKDLKKEITRVLTTEQCIIGGRGSSCQVTIGHSGLTQNQLVDNVVAAVGKLAESIPGGEANIRTLYLKTSSSPSLPIYASLGKNTKVQLPQVVEQSQEIEPEIVSTVMGARVKIDKKGRIELIKSDDVDGPREDAQVEEDDDDSLSFDDELSSESEAEEKTVKKTKVTPKSKKTVERKTPKADSKKSKSPKTPSSDETPKRKQGKTPSTDAKKTPKSEIRKTPKRGAKTLSSDVKDTPASAEKPSKSVKRKSGVQTPAKKRKIMK